MWNFVNTMGHPGHAMRGPFSNQKREFSIHIPSFPVIPGKFFTNPNFVNKHNPITHSYQNNVIGPDDTLNVNGKKNFSLVNSSQNILDVFKENQVDTEKSTESVFPVEKTTKMSHSRKRNKKNRRKRQKKECKSSQQNKNGQIIELMELEVEPDPCMLSSQEHKHTEKGKPFNMVDFVLEIPSTTSQIEEVQSDKKLLGTVISVSPPAKSLPIMRERQISLAESEDSFIIFDSGTDEELNFLEESDDDSSVSDSEDDLDSSSSIIPFKRVRFADDNDLCEIHPMVQWSFAYQQARKGPWEEYARDRDRFSKKVGAIGKILSPIFSADHRNKVYRERFQDPKDRM